jgi:hypothetical protein
MKYSSTKPIPKAVLPVGNNMHICFGRHTGYGGYSDWIRGGRHIVVDEDLLGSNIIETWNQLEDGIVSGHVVLNATYNKDEYPLVLLEKTFANGSVEGGGSEVTEMETTTPAAAASMLGNPTFDTTRTTTQTTVAAVSTMTLPVTTPADPSKSPLTTSMQQLNTSVRKLPLQI